MRDLLECYRTMLIIRFFELEVEKLFSKGLVQGTTHCSIGQEAVAVGVCSVLRKGDLVTSTHRGHGHFIACGGEPRRIMAELFGKQTGYSGGRGGSQFMADFKLGFIGANGITGGSIPVATGAGLSAKLQKKKHIVISFFGDGASNQGTFHESLNMASLWNLPVLYVCENNMYAMSTHVSNSMPIKDVAIRASGYAMESAVVDGNDIEAVLEAASSATEYVRKKGPFLLELKTYRQCGHSRGDPQVYKSPEEKKQWLARDPIVLCRKKLKTRGIMDSEQDARIRAEAKNVVRQAVQFAGTSADPDPGTVLKGVFA